MPNIAIQPATAPNDAAFPPANAQALLNFVAAYLSFSGLENLTGVIISEDEPAAADRDKVWAKRDGATSRVLAFYSYNGGWLPIPFIVPSGSAEPAGAKNGELFFNTDINALKIYSDGEWTTNLTHTGTTAERPEAATISYRYFDTTIGCELRFTSRGWSTASGGVGDIKMVDFATEDNALDANPGWVLFTNMAGRFPLGSGGDITPQTEGGVDLAEMKVEWSAQGRSASGGSREATASFLGSFTINGVEARSDGTKYDALTKIGADKTINLTPPHKVMIFLRKEF